jgi:hypothetical protein
MAGGEMPLEHLTAPAAFERDHIIAVDGSPYRYRGCPLSPGFDVRFTEADERLMHGRD